MKLKYIDSLRGIAVLAVIIIHTGKYGSNDYPELIKTIINAGSNGVQLFYVASAFTIFLSYHYRKEREVNLKRNFFIRRFFRIAPMYYLGIIYYLFQNGLGPRHWLGDAEAITLNNIISNLTFTHGINPYWINSLVPGGWSITVEMTFYAIVPILFNWISNVNQALRFTILSLLGSIIINSIFSRIPLISDIDLWYNYLFLYFPNQISIFGLGIIAYFIIIKKDRNISALNYLIISIILITHSISNFIPTHFLFGLAFLVLMISLSKNEFSLLVNKFTMFLGKISFSAYLVHFAVLHWLNHFQLIDIVLDNGIDSDVLNYIFRLSLVIALTSVISMFLLRFIEQPLQRTGKNLILKLEQKDNYNNV